MINCSVGPDDAQPVDDSFWDIASTHGIDATEVIQGGSCCHGARPSPRGCGLDLWPPIQCTFAIAQGPSEARQNSV